MLKTWRTDISAEYCGLRLRSPIVVGACPICLECEQARMLTIAGAGGLVLPSLFEEQIVADLARKGTGLSAEEQSLDAQSYQSLFRVGVNDYLDAIPRLKRQVGIPIFASLNGHTLGTWMRFGERLQAAGVDGVEVCFEGVQRGPSESANEIEDKILRLVEEFCDLHSFPVAVKLSPFHTNLSNFAWRLLEVGAMGVVCFGSEPLWKRDGDSGLQSPAWHVSSGGLFEQTLRGVTNLNANPLPISIAASGGITSTEECVQTLAAGADVSMITSEIYRAGPDAIAHIAEGLVGYLERHDFETLDDLRNAEKRPLLARQDVMQMMMRSPEEFRMHQS